MPLLVHHRQQLFLAYLLRQTNKHFNIVAHLEPGSGSGSASKLININDLIPKVLGYHPHMELLVGSGHRIYNRPVPDLSLITERDIIVNGFTYRYCVMDDSTYCPILLAKLLTMKNVVVLTSSDPDVADFYRACTVQTDNDVKDMNAGQLRDLGELLYNAFKRTEWTNIDCCLDEHNDMDDQQPEDKYSVPQVALVTKDKEGKQHLTLSQTNGPDSLPDITIWTPNLPDNPTEPQRLLLQRCWLDNRYPVNKITWVVQNQSGQRPDWWTWGGDSVLFQRDTLSDTADFIVVWSLNYYYFPHSTYAKVKLLMDHSDINTVGSALLGEYQLRTNRGYQVRIGPEHNLPTVEVIAYRPFRHRYFLDSSLSWKGWISTYMDFPFNYNAIRIDFTEETESGTELQVIKLLSSEIRSFMNRLYRKLVT